jgi:hypothetical protein
MKEGRTGQKVSTFASIWAPFYIIAQWLYLSNQLSIKKTIDFRISNFCVGKLRDGTERPAVDAPLSKTSPAQHPRLSLLPLYLPFSRLCHLTLPPHLPQNVHSRKQNRKLARTPAHSTFFWLWGEKVLITGASAGIGKASAIEFARAAAPEPIKLVLTARRLNVLEELKKEIESKYKGTKVYPLKLDVSIPAQVKGLLKELPAEVQDIDVLVNNAYFQTAFTKLMIVDWWREWNKLGISKTTISKSW